MHRHRFTRLVPAVVILLWGVAKADRVDQAIATARQLSRPILAVGSSESCGPCRELHRTLRETASLRPLLAKCVVLEMDVNGREFRRFASQFAADTSRIPMVYVVLPDGEPIYARSGGLSAGQIAELLSRAVKATQPSPAQLAKCESILEAARVDARRGNLIESLHAVDSIVALPGDVEPIRKAIEYRGKLTSAIEQWLQDLDQQMAAGVGVHGAAYRIAELYVELPGHAGIHEYAGNLLRRYQANAGTRSAVLQAKSLLRAHFHEDRQMCDQAMDRYEQVVAIDKDSPAAEFARERLTMLRQKLASKLTAGS